MQEKIFIGTDEKEYVILTDEPGSARGLLASGEAVVGLWRPEAKEDWSGVRYLMEDCSAEKAAESAEDVATDQESEDYDLDYLRLAYARSKGLPRVVSETERLLIRETVPEDAKALVRMYEDGDVKRYLPGLHSSVEEEMAAIEDYRKRIYEFYDFGTWIIVLKETGEVIGRVGLEQYADREGYELGYVIAADYRHYGYAKEACLAVLGYAKENLSEEGKTPQIYARIAPENEASLSLARKIGITVIRIV